MNTYKAVRNPTKNPGAWAIEWRCDDFLMAHICENFATEAAAKVRINALAPPDYGEAEFVIIKSR